MPRVEWDLTGDSRQLVAAVQDGVTAFRELKSASDYAQRGIDDVGKSSRSTAKEVNRLEAGLNSAKNAALSVGGEFGGMAGQLENAGKAATNLYKSVGLVGTGLGALVVSITAALGISAKWSLELGENVAKLDKLNESTNKQKQAADRISDALKRQDGAWTKLKTTIGTTFEPVMSGVLATATKTTDALTGLADGVTAISKAVFDFESSGALAIWEKLFGDDTPAPRDTGTRFKRDMGDTARGLIAGLQEGTQGPGAQGFTREQAGVVFEPPKGKTDPKGDAAKAAAAVAKALAAEEAERKRLVGIVEKQLDATADLDKATQDAFRASLEGQAKLAVEHGDRLKAIDELEAKSQDHAAAEAARAAEQVRYAKELADLRAKEGKEADEKAEKEIAAIEKIRDARVKAEDDAKEKREKDIDATLSAYNDLTSELEGFLQKRIDKQGELSEAEKEQARVAFNVSKGLALVQIAINTAVAITKALADLGPFGGPIAAGLMGAAGAVQAGVVAGQKPPEFPGGGIVPTDILAITANKTSADHGLASVEPLEGIVNRGGMADLGEEGLRRINQRRGAGSEPIVVVNQYRHKVFDAFVQDNIRRGGPLASAIAGTRKPGHSRRGT